MDVGDLREDAMNLCECGCGAEVRKRFRKGHWSRVPENNQKIREWSSRWQKTPVSKRFVGGEDIGTDGNELK